MKKSGILNREIASVLANLGHTDTIIIADCGLPIPENIQCIDVSLGLGNPSFLTVLKAVTADMAVEEIMLANEIQIKNDELHQEIIKRHSDTPVHYIPHEELKKNIKGAKAVIRTGEATPYANMILQADVIF
ncbi:D-ribose pyranase [Virgibacillus alimentarius]|uniref:D-ribose pyranase n=1 Tax=Virgibacillus alimentarius TaxID=698769 RepID=UPI0004930A58|nr:MULTISPECIES: D-ribose pyranase [Virgibacillus]HLR67672.1 D-ribose pyranase [Virgibacillus sp.]